MLRHVLLVVVVVAGAGASAASAPAAGHVPDASAPAHPGSPGARAADAPTVAAARWLAALRARDAQAIARLTGLPFLADGFDPETGPVRDKCKRAAVGGPEARWLRMRADNEAARAEVFECLFKDAILDSAIPKYAPDAWPSASPPPARTATGALKVIQSGQLARRLGRYKADVKALASDHTLVATSYTDNNGITVEAVLAIKGGQVAAFLADRRLEH